MYFWGGSLMYTCKNQFYNDESSYVLDITEQVFWPIILPDYKFFVEINLNQMYYPKKETT